MFGNDQRSYLGEVVELDFTFPFGPVTIYAVARQRDAFRFGFQFLGSNSMHEVIRRTCRQLAIEQSLRSPIASGEEVML